MRESTTSAGDDARADAFCEECLTYGTESVLLRVCLSCGHVGCADGSRSDHAAEHYAETDHPIAAAIASKVSSRWCYSEERCYPDERPV